MKKIKTTTRTSQREHLGEVDETEILLQLDDGRIWSVLQAPDGTWGVHCIYAGKRTITRREEREIYTRGSALRQKVEEVACVKIDFWWDARTIAGALAAEKAEEAASK